MIFNLSMTLFPHDKMTTIFFDVFICCNIILLYVWFPIPPALEGSILTTGLPGKSRNADNWNYCLAQGEIK